jgi:hypothetical protein
MPKGKAPSFQFYPADWLKDADLQMCSFATIGLWTNMLCYMWQKEERGILEGTPQQFVRLLGCTIEEFDLFLSDVEEHPFADVMLHCNANVMQSSKNVTVINRRMYREDKERKANTARVMRHRQRKRERSEEGCNALVAPPSSSSSSSSSSNTPHTPQKTGGGVTVQKDSIHLERFDQFWEAYPRKTGKGEAKKLWLKRKPSDELTQKIIQAVNTQKHLEQWVKEKGRFIPHPSTWLNREQWDDGPASATDQDAAENYAVTRTRAEITKIKAGGG